MPNKIDLTGKKFGKLTVLHEDTPIHTSGGHSVVRWVCQCDCGNVISVRSGKLRTGNTSSCGCAKSPDITGKRFGKLVVKKKIGKTKDGATLWECECDCGNVTNVRYNSLTGGITKSCGCLKKIGYTFEDLTGKKFNKLTVLERVGTRWRSPLWKCRCDCGNITYVNSSSLKGGTTKGCGCGEGQSLRTHGLSNTRLNKIWDGMKSRCYNKNSTSYKYYGARGIMVCDEWKNDFKAFYDWAINNGYQDGLSIDRINVDGNYEPSNCRWVDSFAQLSNKSTNVYVEYKGKKQTLSQWSRELNIPKSTLGQKLRKNNFDLGKVIEEYKVRGIIFDL